MIPYLREGLGALAGAALATGVALVAYEGLPIVKSIPFIQYVPIIGDIAEGRVDRARRTALEGYVRKVELDALTAEHAKTLRLLAAARKAAEGFQELLAAEQERNRQQEEQDRIEDAEYEGQLKARDRACYLDADDLRFLMR